MDPLDHQSVKCFWEALTLNVTWTILGESQNFHYPLPPDPPMGGLNERGDLMSLAPKCNMFLESLCQELTFITKLGLT